MPENIRNIIYRFSQELRRILGDKLTKIIVYGSYARGDFRENSDIDIMILVKMSDEEIRLVKNDIYDLAFEFEINTGIEFSPIIKNEDQYEYWIDTLPFYRNVRPRALREHNRKSAGKGNNRNSLSQYQRLYRKQAKTGGRRTLRRRHGYDSPGAADL